MFRSAWNLYWDGWGVAVGWMGTTLFAAIVYPFVFFGICVLLMIVFKGLSYARQHFPSLIGLSAAATFIFWVILSSAGAIKFVYDDHQKQRGLAHARLKEIQGSDGKHGLIGDRDALNAAINGPDGYKKQLADAKAETRDIQGRLDDEIKRESALARPVGKAPAVDAERNADPDALYQLGEVVVTTVTPTFDDPHHTVTFLRMDVTTKADTSKTFEYRKWVLNCNMNGNHLPDDSLPPGMMASVVMPKPVYGWTCAKVGASK